jgi:hypothetical protein
MQATLVVLQLSLLVASACDYRRIAPLSQSVTVRNNSCTSTAVPPNTKDMETVFGFWICIFKHHSNVILNV